MLVVALSALAVAIGALFANHGPRGLAIGVAVVGALPWLAFVLYYAHVLDGASYYEWRSWPSTDLLASLVGVPAGVVAALAWPHRPRSLVAGFGGAALLLVVAFAKPLLTRMPSSWVKDTWRDDVCLQSTPATCGPCAAATVVRALGTDVKESELAQEASSTVSGTLNWLLARALRERGFMVTFRDVDNVDDVRAPAVIGVGVGAIGHFVAYLGKDATGAYIIGEPLKGRLVLDQAELSRRYRFDRFAMEIARPAAR